MQIGRKADPNDHEARILGAIVTEQSLVSDFSEDFRAWLRAHPRREWPNLYIDVHRFTALYRYLHPEDRYLHPEDRSPGNVVGTNAMTAEEFIVSDPTNEALVVLGYELPNWFRVVPTMTSIRWTTSRIDHRSINRGRFLRSAQPRSNRQIRSVVLCVDLVGSRRIWPAHIGRVVGPDGSRRILSDRLDDQTDDQAMRRGALGHPDDGRHCGAVTRYSIW